MRKSAGNAKRGLPHSKTLSRSTTCLGSTGLVSVADTLVRFVRPGLTEEYSVSVDGVRQDFVVTERLAGTGELQVGLGVSGARVEAMPGGARLVLEQSGRKIAYSRLHATDATGKELSARVEVLPPISESGRQRAEMMVVVDDSGALYPVRIDPTFSDANWISMGGVPGTSGTVLATAVDGAGNLRGGPHPLDRKTQKLS